MFSRTLAAPRTRGRTAREAHPTKRDLRPFRPVALLRSRRTPDVIPAKLVPDPDRGAGIHGCISTHARRAR